jgi:hypothetical protein
VIAPIAFRLGFPLGFVLRHERGTVYRVVPVDNDPRIERQLPAVHVRFLLFAQRAGGGWVPAL